MEASNFNYESLCSSEKKCGNHFIVEELLDLSNEDDDVIVNGVNGENCGAFEVTPGNSASSVTAVESCNSYFSGGEQNFSGELCEPQEDLMELEWLSNFVEEDSFSREELKKLELISGLKSVSNSVSVSGSVSNSVSVSGSVSNSSSITETCEIGGNVTAQQPTKARSKRPRSAPNDWSSRLLLLTQLDSDLDSDSMVMVKPNPFKKCPKPFKRMEPGMMAASDGRKCLHCATDKTPQWRTGPMGPKTLCNACGVRYKSGRLVPEYRPAASPTFVTSKHSNSHRKVMELRRKKEMQEQQFANCHVFDDGDDKFLIHQQLGTDFRQLI